MEQELLVLLGKFITFVAGGAGGAFLIIKFWLQKRIENDFKKDLELFKTQKLHEFDLLLTRKTKWHEKEHEVLSESWKKLMEAKRTLSRSLSMIKESQDFIELDDEQLEKYAKEHDFTGEEKDYFLSEADKNKAYRGIRDFRELMYAHKSFHEFHEFFENNRVFLRPYIKEKFKKIDDYIWSAWVSKKMALDDGKIKLAIEARKIEKEKIEPLIKDIEDIIQKELFPGQS